VIICKFLFAQGQMRARICIRGVWGRELVTFYYLLLLFVILMVMERFATRVLKGGKVTIPKRLRELLKIEDGVYARARLVDEIPKDDSGKLRRITSRVAN